MLNIAVLCVVAGFASDDMQKRPGPPDAVEMPRPVERFYSANRKYRLELYSTDHWASFASRGRLFEGRKRLWDAALPQFVRAKYAFVGDAGRVCLVDEWFNKKPSHAIVTLDPLGKIITDQGYDWVVSRLKTTPNALFGGAMPGGVWIAAKPYLSRDRVEIPTSAGPLTVDISHGRAKN